MEDKTSTAAGEQRQPGCFICMTAIPLLEQIWSAKTRGHFRSSRIEFLKGIRSIIDDRIERLSREHAKGTHVTVE